ncbi:unnamed protein product [Penicillium discolor]
MESHLKDDKEDSPPDVNIAPGVIHVHFSEEEEKKVVRKIDFVILPMVCTWQRQLVAEYPVIYLMCRLPLAKFVGITIILWGGTCMCLAAPTTFAGFGAVRFLLGATEGAVSPAFVTITSMWYRRDEHSTRVGIWITMNGLAQVLGSLLMYGIGKTVKSHIAPWRVLFLVCGALTTAFGFAFYLIVPTGPKEAWFLTKREREVLLARMAQDREGGDKANFSVLQMKETLMDVRSWFFFAFGILATMQSPVLTFASLIIDNLNYNRFQTMLFTSPSGAVQIVAIWVGVIACIVLPNKRCLVIIFLAIPPLIGNVLLLKLPLTNQWGLIVCSWLVYGADIKTQASCISDVMAILLSLSASNVKGNTKRAIVNTFYFIGYCVGCIAGPQLWKTDTAPRFFDGVVTAIVTWCLLVVAVGIYWYLCRLENLRRDQGNQGTRDQTSQAGEEDLTDIQDPFFRYSY